MLGVVSFFLKMPYAVTAEAITRSKLCFVPIETFNKLMDTNPEFSRWISILLSRAVRYSMLGIIEKSCLSGRHRLEKFLWKLVQTQNGSDQNKPIKIQMILKNWEVAQLLALTPQHLCRLVKQLEFGTMTFKEVLEPARKSAVEGFPVHEVLAANFYSNRNTLCNSAVDPDTPNVYCKGGSVPGLYSIFKNPDMGHTFEVLQKKGVDAFYKGEIAQAIVNKANSLGVILPPGVKQFWTMDDLKKYEARWEDPLKTSYHGYDIYETPPPSQGWAALEMLNILEVCAEAKPFDLAAVVNMIDLAYNVQATSDAARFDHDQGSDRVSLDYYLYDIVNTEMTAWGHTTRRSRGLGGGYQGILFERDYSLPEPTVPGGKGGKGVAHQEPLNGIYRAGSELRKDGAAVGW